MHCAGRMMDQGSAQRLFPIFDARVVAGGPTSVMRHEHRWIEQLAARAVLADEECSDIVDVLKNG